MTAEPRRPNPPPLQREDLDATLRVAADQPDLTSGLVDSFADRVEAEIARRSGSSLDPLAKAEQRRTDNRNQLVLGLASLVMAVPLSAIGATQLGLLGFVLAWVGIVVINVAHAMRRPS